MEFERFRGVFRWEHILKDRKVPHQRWEIFTLSQRVTHL